jgi:hypothetical protein
MEEENMLCRPHLVGLSHWDDVDDESILLLYPPNKVRIVRMYSGNRYSFVQINIRIVAALLINKKLVNVTNVTDTTAGDRSTCSVTFGAVRVPQCGDGLVVVVGGGADVGDHDRLAVPAQRVLQDARQLRVSVPVHTI